MDYAQYPPELIQEMQRVRKQLVKVASAKAPCPACGFEHNHFEAGKTRPEDFDFTNPPRMACPNCLQPLRAHVSLLGGQQPYKWIAVGRKPQRPRRSS